jgi:hypothetical protein
MRAIHFPEANTMFTKPEGMTDEECGSVSAYAGAYEDGTRYVLTCWQPSYEDLQAFNAGRPLVLQILGGMPPVSLWTQDAEGQPNV